MIDSIEDIPKAPEAAGPHAPLGKLGNDLLLHLFGDEGLASLRAGNWKFILVIAPVFGFIADVCTVFGHSAAILFVVCAAIGGALVLPILFRTKYCQHCAIPCVFAFILVIAFGFVAATQRVFAAEDRGVAAKFIPGIPEIQNTLAEILGLQRATLKAVTDVKSDTTDIKQQLAENKTELAKLHAQLDTTNALVKQLVDQLSQTNPAAAAAPETKERLTQTVTSIEQGAATDPRYAKALELLKAGKPAEAEPLLLAVAEDFAKRGDAKGAAAAYRNLGAIAGLADPKRAREAYGRAVALDPDDREALYWHGWLQLLAGDLVLAERDLNRLLQASAAAQDDRGTYRAYLRLGEVFMARGNLQGAHEYEDRAFDFAKRNAERMPANLEWQRDLAGSYERVGDVQVEQGNLPAALTSYLAGLAIMDRLAKSDPGNAGWQRDLSLSYDNVGEVQQAQGNLPAALTSYQASLAIMERLAKPDSGNAGWQRDLSVSYERVGDVQVAHGNLPAALASYKAEFAIADRLAKSDPGNARLQYDLSLSYAHLAYIYLKSKQVSQAREALAAGRAVLGPLLEQHRGYPQWQKDLAWFDQQIAALKN
jgi:tetratricopeptide (TPR) repeat protein